MVLAWYHMAALITIKVLKYQILYAQKNAMNTELSIILHLLLLYSKFNNTLK